MTDFQFTKAGTLKWCKRDLVEFIKRTALERYNEGGWDVIVECWSDEDIKNQIGKATTQEGALRKFRDVVSIWADQQADARNSAF